MRVYFHIYLYAKVVFSVFNELAGKCESLIVVRSPKVVKKRQASNHDLSLARSEPPVLVPRVYRSTVLQYLDHWKTMEGILFYGKDRILAPTARRTLTVSTLDSPEARV
jgi:hypothetical protein